MMRTGNCPTGHRDPLAPCRFQIVLALEIATPLRAIDRVFGSSSADPRDEHCHPLWGAPRIHGAGIVAMDMFVVATLSCRPLYGLLMMGDGRRQILWFGVTAHPPAEWSA